MRLNQARWIEKQTGLLPAGVRALLLERHAAQLGVRGSNSTSPFYVANVELAQQAGRLRAAHVQSAYDEQAIRDHAENYARLCSRMHSFEARCSFAAWLHIEPPALRAPVTREGAMARLDDPLWWRRQLRKAWTRAAENSMRQLGVIRKHREPYASDSAIYHRAAQKRRARDFLEGCVAVNELGEQLSLLELAEHSVSNPAIRRGEFMTRVRGFEEIARDLGHVAEFVTLTAPSAFHAQLAAGGENPAYNRENVRAAQAWLCRMWGRARAKLRRLSILVYGFRIAEPHHDATPHWHLLLFSREADAETLRAVLRGIWLSEFGAEPGAAEHRAKFERIDGSRGSAAGYVAKYVSKNIDGAGSIGEAADAETGVSINDGIKRVDAWASIHGIRQFQQIGGPPVGLWREARRLRDRVQDRDIERARDCADRGDWAGFVDAVGGIACGRRTALRIERCETGERNRYGEARPAAPVGLRYASAVELTRLHRWRIERRCGAGKATGADSRAECSRGVNTGSASSPNSSLGPVAITVRRPPYGQPLHGEPSAWTNPNETSTYGPN